MIADRINDLGCTTVITQDECWRHGRTVPLREAVDEALVTCPSVTNVIVTRRTATPINWVDGRDHWYHEIVANQSAECDPEPMDAEDPLFVLYTSGTTSKPKAILHEGAPGTPDKDRTWAIIERYGETILDTSPTAINTFMKWGVQYLQQHDLTSPRFGRRTDQARSLELVLHECWRWPLSHRRHMVADRDGHDHDRAAAQGHRAQRRLRHYPAARHSGKRHQ